MIGKIKVEGLRDIEKNLFKLKGSTARSNVRRAATEALEPMAREMRYRAPRDTSRLVESIDVSVRARPPLPKRDPFEIAVGPGRSARAIVQEFGSYKEPAQPYARPAYESEKRATIDRFSVILQDIVRRTMARMKIT